MSPRTTWARSSAGGAAWPRPSAPSCAPRVPVRASRWPSTSPTDAPGTRLTLLEVGRVVKPHGLRGEVIVDLVTNRVERVAAGMSLVTDAGPLLIEASSPHQGRWIVQFAGVGSREAA